MEPEEGSDYSEVFNSTIMSNSTRDSYLEKFTKIKDIDYFLGLSLVLVVAYSFASLVSFLFFRCEKQNVKLPAVSPFFAKFCLAKDRLLAFTLILIFVLLIFYRSEFGLPTYIIFFVLCALLGVVQMFTEMYIILTSIFTIVKYFNHTYLTSVQLTLEGWKASIGISCWFMAMKYLIFFVWIIIANVVSKGVSEKFFFSYFGLYLSSQFLLLLSSLLHFSIFCGTRKMAMNLAEKALCSQTIFLALSKVVMIPLLFLFSFQGVDDQILAAYFVISDILLVPIMVHISGMIFSYFRRNVYIDIVDP